MIELNRIYNEDCLQGIKMLEDESIDLCVTSPPYNVDLGNNKYNKSPYDIYNDNKAHSEYIVWLEKIFGELYPKLKKGGRVCINIGDGKNGAIPTNCDISHFMTHNLKYIPMTRIIWNKNQASPRTAWGSFKSPSCPSFPTPFEYILVFAKEDKKLQHKGETDLTKEEFVEWSLALWKFAPETRQKKFGHPAMFSEELPKRCIKMFSYIGDTVIDIFSGMGTTCKVARELNRNYIGFELSKHYCDIANERIQKALAEKARKDYDND